MPMIRRLTLRNFKRFEDAAIDLPGHLVLAGPNNTGKTTVLQAIAAWAHGLLEWRKLARPAPINRRVGYAWADLERLAFDAVALRSFELLWRHRRTNQPLQVGLLFDGFAHPLTLEFRFVGGGLVRVRPTLATRQEDIERLGDIATVFVPAIAGVKRTELRLADDAAIRSELAQGRASEVLRNLLVRAYDREGVWDALNAVMQRLFSVRMEAPRRGAELVCEFSMLSRLSDQAVGPALDLAAAGSGMLQVLLVLSLMLTQRGSVLLVDEPDAHLHLILQKSIYNELKAVALQTGSQLIVATHSEKIVEGMVDERELWMMYGAPRQVGDPQQRRLAAEALGVLSHADLLEVADAAGVMYAEDYTDFDILEHFARVLDDQAALTLLSARLVRKHIQSDGDDGIAGVQTQRHWQLLRLANPMLNGLELLDRDNAGRRPESVTGTADALQRLVWRWCEIENYLLHRAAMGRFLRRSLGGDEHGMEAGLAEFDRQLGADFNPQAAVVDERSLAYLESRAASKGLIPAVLQAAGLNQFEKGRFYEIAQCFQPDEVHPEVREKLALLKFAFGVGPDPRVPPAEPGHV